jgi:toxin ParE1/3/4
LQPMPKLAQCAKSRIYEVRFTLEALNHIDAIRFYVEGRSPRAAAHIIERIFAETDRLGEFPDIGRVGTVPGTHEWTVSGLPYIFVHLIDESKDELVTLADFHGAQRR